MSLIPTSHTRRVSINQSNNLKATVQKGECHMSLIPASHTRRVSINQSNNLKATVQKGECPMSLIPASHTRRVSINQSNNLKATVQKGECPMSLIPSSHVRKVSVKSSTNNLKATVQKGAFPMSLIPSSQISSSPSAMQTQANVVGGKSVLSYAQREKLINSEKVRNCIRNIIREVVPNCHDDSDVYADLFNAGMLTAWLNTAKFDPNKGAKFTTFAYWAIRRAISEAHLSYNHPIGIPYETYIAAAKGEDSGIPNHIRGAVTNVLAGVSADESCGCGIDDDDDLTYGDMISDPSELDPGELLDIKQIREELYGAKKRSALPNVLLSPKDCTPDDASAQLAILLRDIPSRDQEVFKRVEGVLGRKKTPGIQVAKDMKMSPGRVTQIVQEVKDTVRKKWKRS